MNLKTRTELKAMRLNLSKGQRPVKTEWRAWQWADLYDPNDCSPMRPYRKPSQKQLDALERGRMIKEGLLVKCSMCGEFFDPHYSTIKTCERCRKSRVYPIKGESVYLDCETTGLGCLPDTDFVEVALIDNTGAVLMHTLCDPGIQIEPGAQEVHGISKEMLIGKPKSSEIREKVIELCENKTVIIYNAAFDSRFFPGIHERAARIHCCMKRFAEFYGEWHDYWESYTWQSLSVAADYTGYEWKDKAHGALEDARATRHVWGYMKDVARGLA